jgi:hypothetical protein
VTPTNGGGETHFHRQTGDDNFIIVLEPAVISNVTNFNSGSVVGDNQFFSNDHAYDGNEITYFSKLD